MRGPVPPEHPHPPPPPPNDAYVYYVVQLSISATPGLITQGAGMQAWAKLVCARLVNYSIQDSFTCYRQRS